MHLQNVLYKVVSNQLNDPRSTERQKSQTKITNNPITTDSKSSILVASKEGNDDDDSDNCYYHNGSDNDSEAEVCQCKDSDIVYYYEESSNCYNFFAPFLWATLLCDGRFPGGITFTRHVRSLRLFQPVPASQTSITATTPIHP